MIEAIRSVLSRSWAYQSFWHGIGGDRRNRVLVRDYIRPRPGDRVLDIGCGPGTMAPYLPGSDYVGFDASAEYIDRAQRRFPQARFVCQRVSHYTLAERDYFDIVLALGVLHHLDDDEALTLFQIARDAMKRAGGWSQSTEYGPTINLASPSICLREIVDDLSEPKARIAQSPQKFSLVLNPASVMICCGCHTR